MIIMASINSLKKALPTVFAVSFLALILYSHSIWLFVLKLAVLTAILPVWLFTAWAHAEKVVENSDDFMRAVYSPLPILAGVGSAAFNVLIAWAIFWEWPRELFFTNRLKRLRKNYDIVVDEKKYNNVKKWANRVNAIHDEHI